MVDKIDGETYAKAVEDFAEALVSLGFARASGLTHSEYRQSESACKNLEVIMDFHRQIAAGMVTTWNVDAFGRVYERLRKGYKGGEASLVST